MKRIVAVLMLSVAISIPAFAVDQGYYVYADWDIYSLSNAPVRHSDGISIGGGYHFNPYAGVEAGFTAFSGFLLENAPQISPGPSVSESMGAYSYQVSAVGTIPLSDRQDLFGKLGWASSTLDYSYSTPAGGTGSGNATKSNTLFGIGWWYALGQNVKLRVQYENLGKVNMTVNSKAYEIGMEVFTMGWVYDF